MNFILIKNFKLPSVTIQDLVQFAVDIDQHQMAAIYFLHKLYGNLVGFKLENLTLTISEGALTKINFQISLRSYWLYQ